MDLTELQRIANLMEQLQAWDWQADLREDERTYVWLARHTRKSRRSVYDYTRRRTAPPLDWLVRAWKVLKEGERVS